MTKNKKNQKHVERVVVSKSDTERHRNLLNNAKAGFGSPIQQGSDILLSVFVNNNEYKYVEYRIKDAQL